MARFKHVAARSASSGVHGEGPLPNRNWPRRNGGKHVRIREPLRGWGSGTDDRTRLADWLKQKFTPLIRKQEAWICGKLSALMNTPRPIAFEIQRIGQKRERITADAFETEGAPPKYVFRREDEAVFDIFIQALEREPKPIFPPTPEANAAWKAFVRKQHAVNRVPHLER
jgi:hypothetical protein